ncbi:MAG: helix-turn-helix transcriptional regulator, partial [Ktedonobacteraceae bacterium]|nr:helix-turn-helix transcriptional regulator [Ktedonobacteraceae bacterium]
MTQKEQPHSHRSVDQAGSQARSLGQRIRWYRARQGISQEALAETIGASSRSIRRWEQDLALPQGLYRERLCQALSINPQELFGAISLEEVQQVLWTVPFPRNPCFTGRETILQTLHELLDGEQPAALSGLGGIGKTQVAIEYAYRYAHDYSAVIWLAAETAEELIGSLQALAEQAQIPPRQMANQSQLVMTVQRWLAAHPGWLIIADNVEDPDLLNSVLPPLRQGALLITTRRQALGTLAAPLKLPSMSREEGITLILRRARRLDEQQTQPEVAELVRLLDGFPLALDQAGSYLEETGCSVADYLKRYQDQRQLILARRGSHGGAHPASVTTTLKLSVERVEREHPAAVDLLRVCAFLHPETIPEELLSAGAPFLGPGLQAVLVDPYQFDQILAALRNASLVTRSPETRTLSVHRLVQAVLTDWMEPEEAHRWQTGIIQMVNTAFPDNETTHATQCERYLSQALACVPLIEQCA